MNDLRVSALQFNMAWENKEKNLEYAEKLLGSLQGKTDIAVLPEMFTTGFSMNSRQLAEPMSGETMQCLHRWATAFNMAVAGSFIAEESGNFYNRGFFITPENEAFFYDKRHLYRIGEEGNSFLPGNKPLIVPYRGWNIRLLICYDLLIYTANWPASRAHVWKTLLAARAIENMAYVCGANRIGGVRKDNIFEYAGHSQILDAKGKILAATQEFKEDICTATLCLDELQRFREKFPAWRDADTFSISD